MKVVLTGSEGFIGSHVRDLLLADGHKVLGIDSFEEQVHGPHAVFDIADRNYRLVIDRVSAFPNIQTELRKFNPDIIVHLAAAVGVGQSMYAIAGYVAKNTYDTAQFLEMVDEACPNLKQLVVASSMSCYGEGPEYMMEPYACKETEPLKCESIYAVTKRDQEELCLIWGKSRGIPTQALRLFNTYGPGQALSNPYTGVAAIFACRNLNNKSAIVFENGIQTRDFIYVEDTAMAFVEVIRNGSTLQGSYNIGTGRGVSLRYLAEFLAKELDAPAPIFTDYIRKGDIRHCFANRVKAGRAFKWTPQVVLEDGLKKYVEYLKSQPQEAIDKVDKHIDDMIARGLIERK